MHAGSEHLVDEEKPKRGHYSFTPNENPKSPNDPSFGFCPGCLRTREELVRLQERIDRIEKKFTEGDSE